MSKILGRKGFNSKAGVSIVAAVLLTFSFLPAAGLQIGETEVEKHHKGLLNFEGNGKSVTITVQSSDNITKLSYKIHRFEIDEVVIDGEEYITIRIEDESNIMKKSYPDIPNICRSIIIPDDLKMEVRVIDAWYKEIDNVLIAPSKGILPKTVNPADIPYEFGDVYGKDVWFPEVIAKVKDPYILRDFRGQVVIVYPFQYNPFSKKLRFYNQITIEVFPVGPGEINVFERVKPLTAIDSDFKMIYERHFLNFNNVVGFGRGRYTPVEEQGNMLIICYDDFYSTVEPLLKWKNMKGVPCEMVNMSEVGTTADDVKAYIEDYYHSKGLTFVLLGGDAEQVPTPIYGTDSASDPTYSYIVGDDHYPDLFVGRFSAQNDQDIETQVERSIEYEKYPQEEADWYHRGVGIASNEGPGDDDEMDWEHIRNIRTQLLDYYYTEVDELYDGSHGGEDEPGDPTDDMVSDALNAGRGIINYCGHGGPQSWVTTGFDNDDVNALTNDNMLPFIWSVACNNGDFNHYDACFGEAWLRATHNGEPTGAICTFMSSISQYWSPPMEAQDEFNAILVESYEENKKNTFGGISFNGCMSMNDKYGEEGYDMTDTWHVFGDPSLQVRTDTPSSMEVQHDPYIQSGATSFDVTVVGVEGALCAISHNGVLLGYNYTDENGETTIYFDEPIEEDMEEVDFVVTAYNKIPYITTLEVRPPKRQPAEFEPMEGVMINYGANDEFAISYDIIREMSEVAEIVTIVDDEAQKEEVEELFQANGIDLNQCSFLIAPSNSWWTRDYGPWFIFNDTTGEMEVVNFTYNRPRPDDDAIPEEYAENQSLTLHFMDLVHAGGNYMTDGQGIAVSTDMVLEENPDKTQEEIEQIVFDSLGIHTYHIRPDVLGLYIKHIDCWAKYLSPDTIMIIEVHPDHSQYDEIENEVNYFKSQTSCWGTPYNVVRVYVDMGEPYINSLILNGKVLVPITGSEWDDEAIASYEEAMPGYEVLGFTGDWLTTDALHCRVKGIPDRYMLYIEHTPLKDSKASPEGFLVEAKVIPYSGESLVEESPLVYWRTDGDWNTVLMEPSNGNTYSAYIPSQPEGTEIQYYINAQDESGRNENHPYMGAEDPHTFKVLAEGAVLSYHPHSHNFGDVPQGETASTTFEIWNSGTGTLTYTLSEPCDWVFVSPTSGESTGEHDTITVEIYTGDLTPGPHQCDILIDSNGGTGVFSVYVNVITEQLDQQQTQGNLNFVAYGSRWGSQSFKPTLDTLLRVELRLRKKGDPPNDLVVSIRDSLTGEDLTVISKPPGDIPSDNGWVNFNFDDISVTPGETYYIVLRTTGGNKHNSYVWKFGYNTPYTDGKMWFSSNGGSSWVSYVQYDFCFKTYGRTTPPNAPPVAVDDSYTTSEDTQLNVDAPGVLENDYDPDSGPSALTCILVDDVTHGTLNLNSDGSFTYDPDPDYYGTDSFTYQAFDGEDYSDVATVTIDVESVNDPPTAVNDSYTTPENTQLNVAAPGVLGNDIDDSPLTAVLVDDVTHGTLTLNSDGSFTYTPDTDYVGTDSFTYQAYDGEYYSNVATVTITIYHVNDPPVAEDDTYTTSEDTQLNVDAPGVLENDYDPDDGPNPLTAVLVDDVTHGTLILNSDGSFTYNPDPDYYGTDSFTYQAYDGEDYSNTATVTIDVTSVNDPPVAVDDTAETAPDTPVDIPVTDNDYDIDGTIDTTTVTIQTDASHGSTEVDPLTGVVTYTPDPGYEGPDSFTYTVNDNEGANSNIATVNITVVSPEELDQEQTKGNYNFVAYGSRWGSQSFKPTLETLTRVELRVRRRGNPPNNLVVSIRDSLTGEDLTVISKPPSEIPSTVGWIDFDFEDIAVTPGETYYIVLRTTGGNMLNSYIWKFGYNTPYTDGEMWFSSNAGASWSRYPQYDFCFKTYGY
jgi:VCBS repeat-containing protein